jgi:putative membrane protein
MNTRPSFRTHVALLASALAVLAWSGIAPAGRFNWLMETFPAMIGGIIMVATYRRFRLTTLVYALVWFFSLILMVGGHYTYAEVPVGNWARDLFHLQRNHFDRLGHFFQGVIPAMLARELLLRTSPLRPGKWLFAICVSIALAISASYELFEWRYAVTFGGQRAEDFLGSQGDFWDAQNDMAMALLGAIVSLLALGRWHTRQLEQEAVSSVPSQTSV